MADKPPKRTMKFKFEEGEKVYCTENEVLYKSKASLERANCLVCGFQHNDGLLILGTQVLKRDAGGEELDVPMYFVHYDGFRARFAFRLPCFTSDG